MSSCQGDGKQGEELTGVGEVRLVARDGVGDVLLPLAELLHIVRDDGLVSCGGHFC